MELLNAISTLTFLENDVKPVINSDYINNIIKNTDIGNIHENEFLLREINRIIDGKFPNSL
jgi:hypothetical protein